MEARKKALFLHVSRVSVMSLAASARNLSIFWVPWLPFCWTIIISGSSHLQVCPSRFFLSSHEFSRCQSLRSTYLLTPHPIAIMVELTEGRGVPAKISILSLGHLSPLHSRLSSCAHPEPCSAGTFSSCRAQEVSPLDR